MFEKYGSVAQFLDGANISPEIWRGGAKTKWRGAANAMARKF